MKISKQKLKELIKEELETFVENKPSALDKTRKQTTTQARQTRTQAARSASSEKITPQERSLIDQMRELLTKYAEDYNLASGNEFTLLKRVAQMMSDKLKDSKSDPQGSTPDQ